MPYKVKRIMEMSIRDKLAKIMVLATRHCPGSGVHKVKAGVEENSASGSLQR